MTYFHDALETYEKQSPHNNNDLQDTVQFAIHEYLQLTVNALFPHSVSYSATI